jgi:hypothetical protein
LNFDFNGDKNVRNKVEVVVEIRERMEKDRSPLFGIVRFLFLQNVGDDVIRRIVVALGDEKNLVETRINLGMGRTNSRGTEEYRMDRYDMKYCGYELSSKKRQSSPEGLPR